MTPYAEQAEQARELLVEFQKDLEELNAKAKIGEPSWGKMLYASYITHQQERIIEALDTLARVEAVINSDPSAWMRASDLKRFESSETSAEAYSIEMMSPDATWTPLCRRDAVLKALEGE